MTREKPAHALGRPPRNITSAFDSSGPADAELNAALDAVRAVFPAARIIATEAVAE
jgi:hypothetical protein